MMSLPSASTTDTSTVKHPGASISPSALARPSTLLTLHTDRLSQQRSSHSSHYSTSTDAVDPSTTARRSSWRNDQGARLTRPSLPRSMISIIGQGVGWARGSCRRSTYRHRRLVRRRTGKLGCACLPCRVVSVIRKCLGIECS